MTVAEKSFFNEHDNWTTTASECDREVRAAIKPIFDKWVADGYSPREIAHIIAGSANELEAFTIVRRGMERRKAEQAAKAEEARRGSAEPRAAIPAQQTVILKDDDNG